MNDQAKPKRELVKRATLCLLCDGEAIVLKQSARLMGATYPDSDKWKGDEHFEPCYNCDGVGYIEAYEEIPSREDIEEDER